jgi:hypothetical protein
MLKGNPEFLVVRGSSRADVVVFALVLAFGPPLLVVLVEAVVGFVWALCSRALHVAAVWCFGFLAVLQLVRMSEPERAAALLLPVLPAAALAFAYVRWDAFRTALSISVALPVLGVLSFVATVPLAVDDAMGANVAVRGSTPVVVVVLDELPTSSLLRASGTLDEVRYPGFARLARDAVWYPRATTVHEFTTQAVPAILTGRRPEPGALPTLSDHPENLFSLLGERYDLRVTEPVTRLCPSRYCPTAHVSAPPLDRFRGLLYDSGVAYLFRVLPSSLRVELPPIGDRWGGFGDGGGNTRERLLGALDAHDVDLALEREDHRPRTDFEQFLGEIRRGAPARSLYFGHFMLPHTPWRLLPSGHEYGNAATVDGILDDFFNDWSTSGWQVDQALQRHLLQLGYTDRLIGSLVRRLQDAGLYERALVVVTADHGVSFEAGGSRRFVTGDNVADIAAVPLFVKYPGVGGGRVDRRTANVTDIVPTIADVLGVQVPWRVDGRSLRSGPVARSVTIARREGDQLTVPAPVVDRGVLATARRNAARFGEGRASMYRIGPHPELLGDWVADLSPTRSDGVTVRFDGEALFGGVRRGDGFVPARVVGDISGGSFAPNTPLAVAVNGRIAATTRSFLWDGKARFAVLVPEGAFRDGANAIDLYAARSSGAGLRLALLGGTGRAAQYALAAGGRGVLLPTGKSAPIVAGLLEGRIESPTVEEATVRIRGWAADVRNGARVDRVLLFAGSRLLFASTTTVYRFDVVGVSSRKGLQRIGFVAELPARDVRRGDVRVFAVRGSAVSELEWPGGADLAAIAVRRPS